jgi:DNA recombination protein RmuC
MDVLMAVLLSAILVVMCVLVWLAWKGLSQDKKATVDTLVIQQAAQQAFVSSMPVLKDAVASTIAQGGDVFKGAITASLHDLRFQEELGTVKAAATEIQATSAVLRSVFEQKGARASFAEFQLEEILRDAFPDSKFGIRENLGMVGTPDANIKTADGIVCIDAKFPLENYRKYLDAKTDAERKGCATDFRNDVRRHVDKVAGYVRRDCGTTGVAYAFIPSEAVFHYLADNEPQLLQEAVSHNVVVTSPSTLLASISMIQIAVRAKEITERAEQIQKNLEGLTRHFDSFEDSWNTLRNHIQKTYAKSEEADNGYKRLKGKYEAIANLRFDESKRTDG